MRLLLDTHALLWWLAHDARLGPLARSAIADPGTEVLVSVLSLWEIVAKTCIGKLTAATEDVEPAIVRDGFLRLAITPAHLVTLAGLAAHHRDPIDHLLIAQALKEDAVFVTEDRFAALHPAMVLRCGIYF